MDPTQDVSESDQTKPGALTKDLETSHFMHFSQNTNAIFPWKMNWKSSSDQAFLRFACFQYLQFVQDFQLGQAFLTCKFMRGEASVGFCTIPTRSAR